MTEPVAYKVFDNDSKREFLRFTPSPFNDNVPLYTKEQLHPRVKMTKKQYDRLMWDKQNTDLSTCISYFLEHDGVNKFGLSSENLMGLLTQEDIARAWLNPEETIEIVPSMKWFVRSKEPEKYDDEYYLFLSGSNLDDLDYLAFDYAKPFDTKEEAELWKNPLTEAVQLAVEEK